MNQNLSILDENNRAINEQRQNLFNIILTIAGGALVLSINFQDKISHQTSDLRLLKLSWILFVLSIVSNILMRYFLSSASLIFIKKEHFKMESSYSDEVKAFCKQFRPERKYQKLWLLTFIIFWISFIGGITVLTLFSIINS